MVLAPKSLKLGGIPVYLPVVVKPVPMNSLPGTCGFHFARMGPTSSMVQRSFVGSGTLEAVQATSAKGNVAPAVKCRSLVVFAPAVVVGSPFGVRISSLNALPDAGPTSILPGGQSVRVGLATKLHE